MWSSCLPTRTRLLNHGRQRNIRSAHYGFEILKDWKNGGDPRAWKQSLHFARAAARRCGRFAFGPPLVRDSNRCGKTAIIRKVGNPNEGVPGKSGMGSHCARGSRCLSRSYTIAWRNGWARDCNTPIRDRSVNAQPDETVGIPRIPLTHITRKQKEPCRDDAALLNSSLSATSKEKRSG
jgi:hypothetical protein